MGVRTFCQVEEIATSTKFVGRNKLFPDHDLLSFFFRQRFDVVEQPMYKAYGTHNK